MKKASENTSFLRDTITLIRTLAKNDLKARFAGSYLGIVWAFMQPIITVLVYWFVFEMCLTSGTQGTKAGIQAPFVLWLLAGLVPWFYFSDSWSSATNCFMEYNYLVKKVVFNISILPIVKILSSLVVHVVLVLFTFFMYLVMGQPLNICAIQVIYYSFAMMVLSLGLSYITSAVLVFFRDMREVVNIFLQVGIWATPIMWNIYSPQMHIPGPILTIIKLNPMYYVVDGYRESLIGGVPFWTKPVLGLYFWGVTLVILLLGITLFRKLKDNFADVL
jgi:teichoic acid transport system permease protein